MYRFQILWLHHFQQKWKKSALENDALLAGELQYQLLSMFQQVSLFDSFAIMNTCKY